MSENLESQETKSAEQPLTPSTQPRPPLPLMPVAIVVGILAVGLLLTVLTSNVENVSAAGIQLVENKPFLPEQAGDWTGNQQEGLTENERAMLPPDTEGVRRVYTDSHSNKVYCSVVLAGRVVTSIHRPELCLPGQGWRIERKFTVPIEMGDEANPLVITRLNAVRSLPSVEGRTVQLRSIFTYWFIGKGRTTAHHWQRILWTTQDRVLHNTNHRWAYILVHAPLVAPLNERNQKEVEQQTMELVADFTRNISPMLMAR